MLRYSLAFLLFLSICEANVQDEKLVKARIEVKKRYKDVLHMVDILIIFYSELWRVTFEAPQTGEEIHLRGHRQIVSFFPELIWKKCLKPCSGFL